MADNRLAEAIEDLKRFLAAGINVVSSCPVFLQYPYGVVPAGADRPDQGGRAAGGASLFVNGVDPGFANDWLPLVLTSVSERIDEVRCFELLDYSTYDNATVLFDVMGFGKPLDETPMLLMPGVLSLAWGSVVRQIAAGLDVELDEVQRDGRAAARAGELRDRRRHHRGRHDGGVALRGAWHARRAAGVRARAHHPAASRPRARTGRSRPGRAATGWRSAASRTTRSTCSCSAPTATTTRPGSRPRPCGW